MLVKVIILLDDGQWSLYTDDAYIELKPYGWWFPISSYPNTEEGYYSGFKESVEYLKDVLVKEVQLFS